jgi:hypothetical protein
MDGIGKVVTITTEVVLAVQQPDSRIHYCTRSLLEVAVQRLPLLIVVAFASHRSQSGGLRATHEPDEIKGWLKYGVGIETSRMLLSVTEPHDEEDLRQ